MAASGLGVDVYKALAFGAQGVLIGRPAMWALAACGAAGVQTMVEIMQTELAQTMSACSNPDLRSLNRNLVKIHATATQ
jgi:4-hydroxymandelate oxidase